MSDSPQPRRHMRRGGRIALLGIVVLLSLMGGSYALGRSSDPGHTTSAHEASATSRLDRLHDRWHDNHQRC